MHGKQPYNRATIVLRLVYAFHRVNGTCAVPDGGQPMRDNDGRPLPHVHELIEGLLHEPLRVHVKRRGGLVQQQDGGILPSQENSIAAPLITVADFA